VCNKKAHEFETTGEPKHPAFPAQWFTAYRALSPVNRALLPPSLAKSSTSLIPASGDQDHTPLPSAFARFVGARQHVHRILPPTSVTIAIRPLQQQDAQTEATYLPDGASGIFVAGGVKRLNSFESAAENRRYAQAIFGAFCKHMRRSGAALTHSCRHPPSNWRR
jgi:hypothetical protein